MHNTIKMASRALLAMAVLSATSTLAFGDHSVARQWDDTLLDSIRRDTPRPPVHARNLFHTSVAMYDAWAAFDADAQGSFFHEKVAATDTVAAQNEAVSYAAYRILLHRFAGSPNAVAIRGLLDGQMLQLGYPTDVTTTEGSTPAAVGNRVAATIIAATLSDGSRESSN